MEKQRRQVQDRLISELHFDGMSMDKLIEVAEYIKEKVRLAGGILGSEFIDYESYGYDGAFIMAVKFSRYETDKEMEQRLASEKKDRERQSAAKEKKDAKDRALYEKLKKKFKDG